MSGFDKLYCMMLGYMALWFGAHCVVWFRNRLESETRVVLSLFVTLPAFAWDGRVLLSSHIRAVWSFYGLYGISAIPFWTVLIVMPVTAIVTSARIVRNTNHLARAGNVASTSVVFPCYRRVPHSISVAKAAPSQPPAYSLFPPEEVKPSGERGQNFFFKGKADTWQ